VADRLWDGNDLVALWSRIPNKEGRKGCVMLSPQEVAIIRAEIERLEKVRKEFDDGSIQRMIDDWIEDERRKLVAGDNSK